MSEEIGNGVDVEDFMQGVDEVDNAEVVEVGEEATEKPAETATEKPNVSVTDLLDDVVDEPEEKQHADGYVPTSEHIKLRKRAQAAEAKVKELESQSTRTDAVNSDAEIDDEDFATGKDLKSVAAQIEANAEAKAEARYEAKHAKDLLKAKTDKAVADQEVAASNHPDYYEVLNAMRLNGISPDAKKQIANADNSAEEAYQVGCIVLSRKPVQAKTPTDAPTNEIKAEDGTEEEIFDDIFS